MSDKPNGEYTDFAAKEMEKELAARAARRAGDDKDCFHGTSHDEKDCFHETSHDEKDCFHEPAEDHDSPDSVYGNANPFRLAFVGLRTLPHLIIYIILFVIVAAIVLYAQLSSTGTISDAAIHTTTWTFLIGLIVVEAASYFKAYARLKNPRPSAGMAPEPKKRGAKSIILTFIIAFIFVVAVCIFSVRAIMQQAIASGTMPSDTGLDVGMLLFCFSSAALILVIIVAALLRSFKKKK